MLLHEFVSHIKIYGTMTRDEYNHFVLYLDNYQHKLYMKTDNTFESLLVNEQKELLRHAYALVGQREEAEEHFSGGCLKSVRKKG